MIEGKLKELELLEEEYQALRSENLKLKQEITEERKALDHEQEEEKSPNVQQQEDDDSDPPPRDALLASTPGGMIPSLEGILNLFKAPPPRPIRIDEHRLEGVAKPKPVKPVFMPNVYRSYFGEQSKRLS